MTTFTTQDRMDAERKPMNANELADWVEQQSSFGWSGDFGKFLIDIATMLRQQQEQIDKLTAIVALREMEIRAWENAEVPVEKMADIIEELKRRGFITK